jgi:hypothetical protein
MKYKQEIIFILDNISDDYYFLWECFSLYEQYIKSEYKSKNRFFEALIESYENKYFDFFIGENFNGDEELIPKFELTNSTIEELLDYKNIPAKEIRVTTSKLGIDFLEKCQ